MGRLIDRAGVYPSPAGFRYGMLGTMPELPPMPELPEVERGRRVALKVARGRRIVEARCADDPIVFDRVSPPVSGAPSWAVACRT